MHFSHWLIFCGVALLMSFTPGPAVLLAVSNSISVGPRRAMISSLGNASGLLLISVITMGGLGVVLTASAAAFLALKLAGAGYLIYLGIKQWRSPASAFTASAAADSNAPQHSGLRLYLHGLTVALTNPKAILFFTALFPQFLTQEAPVAQQFALLTATFALCSVLSHVFYVMLARGLKRQLSQASRARLFNRISGGAFVLLGLGLLRLRSKTA